MPVRVLSFNIMNNQRTVALEFGYDGQLVDYVLRQRHFDNAGELVDHLYQLTLTEGKKVLEERVSEDKKAREQQVLEDAKEREKKAIEELREETRLLHINTKCLSCWKANRNVVCLPCSHFSMCNACATTAIVCPRCNEGISRMIETFLS